LEHSDEECKENKGQGGSEMSIPKSQRKRFQRISQQKEHGHEQVDRGFGKILTQTAAKPFLDATNSEPTEGRPQNINTQANRFMQDTHLIVARCDVA